MRPHQTPDPGPPPPQEPAAAGSGGGIWAPQRRALTLGLVTTITLVAFEALAVITILPVVSADLHGLRLYGWVTSAFFLATLLATVVAGERSDRHGPAPVFVTAIALFVAGLTIGGLAPSMPVLVLGRALQGLGAGAIPAVIYASVGRTYPEALRPRLFAVTSSAWVIPGVIGPAVSALVASRFGWRAVFLGLLPLVLVAASLTVPALRRVAGRPRPAGDDPPDRPTDRDGNRPDPPAAATDHRPDRRPEQDGDRPGGPVEAGDRPGRPGGRGLLAEAVLVSVGTGLLLAGLTERNLLIAAAL
ncbi:MAG TPA: MFS transporter, partial [Actinomycetes bacterium]